MTAIRQPFLVHQAILFLNETGDVKRFLHPDFFRKRRLQEGAERQADMGCWIGCDRETLVQRLVEPDDQGRGRRLVLTTDAGGGKSCNLQQLPHAIAKAYRQKIPFRIRLGDVGLRNDRVLVPEVFLRDYLIPCLQREYPNLQSFKGTELDTWMTRLVQSGNALFLFDELDQIDAKGIASLTLHDFVSSSLIRKCPILIAGRPYALHAHWDTMFDHRKQTWDYFQLLGFSPQQQRTFLTDDDGVDRYELLAEEVRQQLAEILEVPRVLSYLRNELSLSDFQKVKNPSDVYLKAVEHLVAKGLQSESAASFGLSTSQVVRNQDGSFHIEPKQIERAMDVLAALAWEMIWLPAAKQPSSQATPNADPAIKSAESRLRMPALESPNFDGVGGKSAMQTLRRNAFDRLRGFRYYEDFTRFEDDMNKLTAMNEALERAIIDSGLREQLLWRNRSLQEFLAAYALCRMSRVEGPDQDRLWQWLYLPHDTNTEAFYWIWRFAAEMEEDSICSEAWVNAMRPLYRPGDGTISGTKRSSELLFRTWGRMDALAPDVIDSFLAEFQSILDGKQGSERARHANLLKDSFITVSADIPFRMGTPREKQGIPANERQGVANLLASLQQNPEPFIEERINRAGFPPGEAGKIGRAWLAQKWREVIDQGIEAYEEWQYRPDETPDPAWLEPKLPNYQMNAFPTLRDWYALFDPGHGCRGEWFAKTLNHVAPTGGHSVFYVSWYDACIFPVCPLGWAQLSSSA